jgi:hypothetical protein
MRKILLGAFIASPLIIVAAPAFAMSYVPEGIAATWVPFFIDLAGHLMLMT